MLKYLFTMVLLLILVGCALPPEDYRDPYPAPNNVVMAFESAWESMDPETYRNRILYDHDEVTSDGEQYASFEFYFLEPHDTHGASWSFQDELEHVEHLFSGEPSSDGSLGSVELIELELSPITEWTELEGANIEGDPFPSGTLFRRFETDLSLILDADSGSEDIDALIVGDIIEFYVIPVDGIDGQGYRLWKWMDLSYDFRGTTQISWGDIKSAW
jgi:hypothetical protein